MTLEAPDSPASTVPDSPAEWMVSLTIQLTITFLAVPLAMGIFLSPKASAEAKCWAVNTLAGLFGYWLSFINARRRN